MRGLLNNVQTALGDNADLKLQGIGDTLMGLSYGQRMGSSPAFEALAARQQRAEQMRRLEDSGLLGKFTPEQQQVLAMMEPGAAQQIIASTLFSEPEAVNLQTFTGPDGTVYQFNPRTGQTAPLTGAKPEDIKPIGRSVLVGADDVELQQRFGINPALIPPGRSIEVKYDEMPDGSVVITDHEGAGGPLVENNIGSSLLPGQEALDKAYAPEYMAWIQGGGADVSAQAAQIGGVLEQLERGEELTGPMVGLQGDLVRSIMNPEAQDAKDRVEAVVQRSLRATLGAQFTADEGERLIARAYNVNLSPQQNAARLRALYTQLESAAQAKQAMANYFAQNGTLAGMPPVRIPTIDEMIGAMDQATPFTASTTPIATPDFSKMTDEELNQWIKDNE